MAVIKTITTNRGVIFPDQYCRIEFINAEKTKMSFGVGIYINQQMAQENNPPHLIEHFSGNYDLYGDNPWLQAYAILKQHWQDVTDA